MKNFLNRANAMVTNNAAVISKKARHIFKDKSGEGFYITIL